MIIPYVRQVADALQFAHEQRLIHSLRQKVPTLASAVEQVVLKVLAKEPKDRFSSVQALAMALEQAG